ncbi:hypothetical protein RD792_006595 [Penstemon davidsonii]|uniref:B box-type domain-containing protein n=1 Tax=Penstemon davidsonii TaxID=160366 RepID=A0ABR0DD11_9LAMI|nr:hypothetical protein RD792_006595 [Penstemon davidsonii]
MKIQCDVCDKDEASVFCVADEAALCSACDHRVHHANKLAGKHQRFSLHHPSPKQIPLCDICQERRAFLFCQQDRAILCIECDIQIHKANEHTQKHTRFLLTGVKLSSTSTLYASSPSSTESASSSLNNFSKSDSVSNIKSQELVKNPVFVPSKSTTPSATAKSTTVPATAVAAPVSFDKTNTQLTSGMNFNGGNSISEYLIDMLPGWHVEDFLDSSKIGDGMPFWGGDMENNMSGFPTEKMGFWVPQVSHQTQNQSLNISFGANNGFKEQAKEFTNNNNNNMMKSSRKWNEENSFAVPQISPPSSSFKRSRNLW